MRDMLGKKSLNSNPLLKNLDMTAYTPGETLILLEHPTVLAWYKEIAGFKVPENYKTLILVPCAKTKPWDAEHSKRSMLYKSYNRIIKMSLEGTIPPVYFATISEPLGIVPQARWGDFPQYDNPGLFKEDFMRTGLYNHQVKAFLGERKMLPFDREAYIKSINILGGVIYNFLKNNYSGRKVLAFVDGVGGERTTHGDMLTTALKIMDINGLLPKLERFPKRPGARQSPLEHILSKI